MDVRLTSHIHECGQSDRCERAAYRAITNCSVASRRERSATFREIAHACGLLSSTAAVFALTALVLGLPLGLEGKVVGITAAMMCYVLLNLPYHPLVRAGKRAGIGRPRRSGRLQNHCP